MDFVPGFIAGFCSITSIYPTEYMRILLQQNVTADYRDIIKKTYSEHGLKGFYRGWTSSMIRNSIDTSIRFGIYNKSKNYTNNRLLSGILTGIVTPIITLPLINITNRGVISQITNNSQNNLKSDIKYLINNPSYIYKGLQLTIYKNILSSVGLFTTYDYLLENLNTLNHYNKDTNIIISGSIAGVVNCSLNNPLDVIITQKQTNYDNQLTYRQLAAKIYKENGIRGFYRGFLIRSTRPIIGRTVMFYTYEYSKLLLS